MQEPESACGEAVSTSPPAAAPRPQRRSPVFQILCIAFVMVRLPFMFTVPMVEAPDEFAHYWVIRFLHDHLRLPTAAEVFAGGPSAVYGSLPQLGYIPHLLTSLVGPADATTLFARFGSLFAGLILLYAAFRIGKELFPDRKLLALALPAVVLFHPQMAFLDAYSNNDSTGVAIASILLLLGIRSLREGVSVARCAWMGVLVGWLALCKYSGLGIMPTVALYLVAAALLHRVSIIKAVTSFLVAGLSAAAVSGWWFVRNAHEFNGDFMGTKTMYVSWATTFHRELHYYLKPLYIIKDIRWWRMMFFSFWGLFGYMNKYMWRPVYFVYLGYLLAAVGGGLVSLYAAVHSRAWTKLRAMTERQKQDAVIWCGFAGAVVINLAAMIWASTQNLGGPQGRYLFISELPVQALLIFGLSRLSKRYTDVLILSWVGVNAAVCFAVWFWLFSMYGFHTRPL